MVRFVDIIPDATRLGAVERGYGIGRTILHVAEIDSTNRALIDLGKTGVEHGTVLVANHQTRGRGKGSRSWFSTQSGSLCVSVLIRTGRPIEQASQLTLLGAVALWEAVADQAGIAASIKWPNDLLVDGRKISGILAEAHTDPAGELDFVVLGFGLNLAIAEADFPEDIRSTAISLSTLARRPIEPLQILGGFLDALAVWLPLWESVGVSAFASTWTRHAESLGQIVRLIDGDEPIMARLLGLADDGALRIQDETGTIRLVHSGEIATGIPVGRGLDQISKNLTGVLT
ncbi:MULTISPECIES: biotin--[acetyl-CoA-carboxylase] ligase [Rhodopseudomonas]|uniref:biotin--[acetyl-CoA-carboxylase] ligase n=1 Tax=Rhodopseudomonas TaxID=1073 RepID=UPI0005C9AB51|nr:MULTISPECIES: biotin--[acetyl-CoA-carboxylase] ligase [Rhodopseudomonas]MDF3812459.1 biotin--[acetyl-CoA-carboxylase] ligase [Rhodopseudomonas sp. BAL398]WOK19458.1 biotin--[acetyl-CoA-carboxylase] ligase [Rhodopseudomonas sp. BAL398]